MERIIAHNPPPRKPPLGGPQHDAAQASPDATRASGVGSPPLNIEQVKVQMQQLAWLMDDSIPIPFLGVRIGVDGLLGLIPGVGDLLSAGIASFIIRQAHALGVPKIILLRMSFNTAVDLVIGAVPLLGDLFDFSWKANKRNVRLVLEHLEHPTRAKRGNWLAVIGMVVSIALVAVAAIYSVGALFAWLLS